MESLEEQTMKLNNCEKCGKSVLVRVGNEGMWLCVDCFQAGEPRVKPTRYSDGQSKLAILRNLERKSTSPEVRDIYHQAIVKLSFAEADLADHDLFECGGCCAEFDIEDSIKGNDGELRCPACKE